MDWLGWICAVGALIGWLWERHERRSDKKELELIRRRSSGPYLRPSNARFEFVYYEGTNPNEIKFRRMGAPASLDVTRNEVEKDLPENHEIFMVLEVSGEACPEVSSDLDGQPVQIRQEAQFDSSEGKYYLAYPYQPQKHGQQQTLTLCFLSVSGIRDSHRYEMKHGHRMLKRVDPK